jgi:hypothetical protein
VLTIDFEGDVPVVPSRPFLMTLSVGSLKAITLDHPEGFIDLTEPMETKQLVVTLIGDGDINLEAVTADQLTVTIQGDGTVYASGVVREQFVSMRDGFGWYYADDLRSEYATVELYGGVNARVWVRQILTPELTGGAKLFYFGSPLVQADDDPLGLVDMGKK